MGRAIKLLATSKKENGRFFAMVAPFLINELHPLYSVNDVFNAIFAKGNVLGDVMFYGSGAGKLPTASAVVADVVDAAKHLHRNIMTFWSSRKLELTDLSDAKRRFCIFSCDKAEFTGQFCNHYLDGPEDLGHFDCVCLFISLNPDEEAAFGVA